MLVPHRVQMEVGTGECSGGCLYVFLGRMLEDLALRLRFAVLFAVVLLPLPDGAFVPEGAGL